MMRKSLIICGFLGLGLAAACTFSPRDTGKAFMFGLTPVSVTQPGPQNESLVVAMPATSPELDTYRIALVRDDGRWDYYAGARWSEFLPSIVQDSLTKTLEHAKMFKAVTTDEAGLQGDKILKTEIRSFQAEYAPGRAVPVVKIRIVASLLTRIERTVLASFTASAEKKASGPELADIQAAFATAFKDAQRQMVGQLGKQQSATSSPE